MNSTPVDLIVRAIARQEGFFDKTPNTPKMRNNPGDLRFAGQFNASTPGWNGVGDPPVATFSSKEAGIVALYRDIWAKVAQGKTLRQIIYTFAPPNENNTAAYLSNVATWTGLPIDVPIMSLVTLESI